MNRCRLCQESVKLINSHIVPEFMYEPVYSGGKAQSLSGEYLGSRRLSPGRSFLSSKGNREHLLCARCDNEVVGNIEGKVRQSINLIREYRFSADRGHIDVDYQYFKLFELSLLWRASISNHWMFANVSLGAKHEEIIRQRLLTHAPGEPHEYGCIVLVTRELRLMRAMIHAQAEKYGRHSRYLVVTPGIHFDFYVSSHTKNLQFQSLFVRKSGKLPLLRTTEQYDQRVLDKLVRMVKSSSGENDANSTR